MLQTYKLNEPNQSLKMGHRVLKPYPWKEYPNQAEIMLYFISLFTPKRNGRITGKKKFLGFMLNI